MQLLVGLVLVTRPHPGRRIRDVIGRSLGRRLGVPLLAYLLP